MPQRRMYGELQQSNLKDAKAKVCLLYTGGTIGMLPKDPDNPSSPLAPAPLKRLTGALPTLGEAERIELGMVSFSNPVDSSDISSEHWIAMASAIYEHYDEFDGFVILHGTDTMAFTTSALSFILNNLSKPVVVTGSQLPISNPRTDAVMNLTSAVHIAGYRATGLPMIPEVVLCFMNVLLRGNRATKVSSTQWQGFSSPNYPALGMLGEHITVRTDLLLPAQEGRAFEYDPSLAERVKIILVNPGMTPDQLEHDLMTEGLEGAIIMTYGAGNMPTSQRFVDILTAAVNGTKGFKNPVTILNITQCVEGMVEMGLYEASSGLVEAGVSSGLDMTVEAAIAKLYWALRKFSGRDVHTQLQVAQRGEQSESLHDLAFTSGKHSKKAGASDRIAPASELIPGQYRADVLSRAVLRIQGLGMIVGDESQSEAVKVFINHPNADSSTPVSDSHCVGEFTADSISKDGNVVRDVTAVVRNVVYGGQPVSVTLVGVNTSIWCRSIHLALYTDARASKT